LLDASVAAYERARSLDPAVVTSVAQTFFLQGQWERAIAADRSDPPFTTALSLAQLRRVSEGLALLRAAAARAAHPQLHQLMQGMIALLEKRHDVLAISVACAELHARSGDASVFVDERGQRINGQWSGSPGPVQHDILTGSNADGTLTPGLTCSDWRSDSTTQAAQVGHSDGLGPGQSSAGALASWNAAHTNQNCSNTAPRGGAGRFYCFAR
jgi:hypothetical protein